MGFRIGVERCACGHRSCKDYWLVGIGKFVQGSGFTRDDAQMIADRLNKKASTHRRLLNLARDYGVPVEGDVAFSQGYDLTLNPHRPDTPDAMRWTSDWWRANADAYESHIYDEDA